MDGAFANYIQTRIIIETIRFVKFTYILDLAENDKERADLDDLAYSILDEDFQIFKDILRQGVWGSKQDSAYYIRCQEVWRD